MDIEGKPMVEVLILPNNILFILQGVPLPHVQTSVQIDDILEPLAMTGRYMDEMTEQEFDDYLNANDYDV